LWLIPIVTVAVTLLAFFGPGNMSLKLNDMIHFRADHSLQVRLHIWRAAWQMFLDHPFFGVGLDQTDLLLPAYYSKLGIQEEFTSHCHNIYLQWLAGAGLIGFSAFLFVCWEFLRRSWEITKRSAWGWSLLLAQIYLLVGGLTENNFFDGEVNHFFTFIWGMVLGLSHIENGKRD
jgi:O-antigen ligase